MTGLAGPTCKTYLRRLHEISDGEGKPTRPGGAIFLPQFLKLWELRMSAALDDFEPLLSKAELAALLNISLRSVTEAMYRGFAGRPPIRAVMGGAAGGKIVRFDRAQVRAWLASSPEPTERRGRGRPKKYRPSGK